MELKLQLSVFLLLIQVSLAVWQRVTVIKGQTLILSCPLTNGHKTNVDWKNPKGFIMFFNNSKGMKDKRYTINKLSESEFTISISSVTFKDGGNYTCSQYAHNTIEKKVEVTVLGRPKMTVAHHKGTFVIKCTAEGNHFPPQIFWKLDHGPEIIPDVQVLHEGEKYVSMDILHVHSVENRVTVKCLVRHPALHSHPLINFVKIGRDSTIPVRTTTTSSPKSQTQRSTEVQRTTTRDVDGPSSESSRKSSTVPSNQSFSSNEPKKVTAPTGLPLNPVTSTGSHLSISGSTRSRNDTISNSTSTTGWTSVPETTEEITYNRTEGNRTGIPDMQKANERNSTLLILLVTCLIFGLLVVVIFFGIKLRRAHITWKRENEESDPSEDSSKSKSSQEEKNSQGQRRRGLTNTAFTQYVVEEPPVITSVINTAAVVPTEKVNKKQTSQPQALGQTSAKCHIKETEL
ncbi:cytotoxic and regulatory T-cell molecule isoform X2 [Micropterus salmoides]|uniref:cytotoxic and regulatory T-cell molecule isoform X2 n=1 Tax=Micropterus salmoides TaxID=27706 RepID=UPI0018EB1F0B|nr:cytotoxic and regulatory T-cell molecule isoform X2 [Micropterus salmoides]